MYHGIYKKVPPVTFLFIQNAFMNTFLLKKNLLHKRLMIDHDTFQKKM